jgi:hypothetical protein
MLVPRGLRPTLEAEYTPQAMRSVRLRRLDMPLPAVTREAL